MDVVRGRTRLLPGSLLAALLAFAVGCGPHPYPVDGQVLFEDGQPAVQLAGGFVTFEPVDATDASLSAQGGIDGDARFTLTTSSEGDGAYPGEYKVIVTQAPHRGPENVPSPQWIEPKFRDLQSTELRVTVEPKENHVELKVGRGKDAKK